MHNSFSHQPSLFENPPIARQRLRRAVDSDNHQKYTREVKGGAFQARVWLPHGGGYSLNIGLFTQADWGGDHRTARKEALWAAARASREFVKRFQPGRTVGDVVAELKAKGYVPAELVVPAHVAAWGPPRSPTEDPWERRRRLARRRERDRERRRYGGRDLTTAFHPGASVPMAA